MKPLKNQNHTPGNHEINVKKTKTGFFSVFLFYFFVAFEFAYMAGPFAVYFYSVYSPVLNFLNEVPVLSTLIRFFLPHVVRETASPFINGIETAGILFSVLGFSIFVIGACQIYYSKLTKKGAVLGGLYKYIRHPQYTSFIVCSFGLMLLWPRYIVIFFFVTLSFGYFFLARAEEKELNYILPTEWFAAEIPMNGIEYRSGHRSPKDYNTSKYKIIFTRPQGRSSGDLDGKQLLTDTKALLPLVEVWVDIEKQEVIEVKEMPDTVKYAGIPEAIF